MNEETLCKHRDVWIKRLSEEVVHIVFTKVDGSEREMICTLREDLIPFVAIREQNPEKPYLPGPVGTIKCYDIENDGWRSFRLESVLMYKNVPLKQGVL